MIHHRLCALVVLLSSVTAVGGLASPARAGGGFLPPTKLDLGTIAMSDRRGGTAFGTSLLIGLNWATVYPKRTSLDFGIGYVGTFLPEPEARAVARGGAPSPRLALDSAHGGYLEVSMLAHERKHHRTWLSGRGELLETGGQGVLGMATRISSELWTGLALGGSGGGMIGVFALGLWAEVGVRELPGAGVARQISMGISGRLPLVAAGH